MIYDELEVLLVDLKPATIAAYKSTCNSTHKLLHPELPCMPDLDWLEKDYQRIPDVLEAELEHSSASTLYARLGHLSSIATKLGYKAAHEHIHQYREGTVGPRIKREPGTLAPRTEANYVPYPELHARAEEYMAAFDLLGKDDPEYMVMSTEDHRVHQSALLAAMNVLTPNVRSALAHAKITTADPQPDHCQNWIYIPAEGSAYSCINFDKVSCRTPPARIKLAPYVTQVLRRSLHVYPRRYLFPTSVYEDRPCSHHEYANRLKKLFVFGAKRAGVETIRHSQVSHYYDSFDHAPTQAERDALAYQMRHSSPIAEALYRKHDPAEEVNAQLTWLTT